MSGKSLKLIQRNVFPTWYHVEELASRVVAQTGIPSDRFHLGKLILQSLKDDPDIVAQIDGALDVSETNGSVLERSIRCAIALKRLGVQKGDVMVLMAPNHLDLVIALYAALYLGILVTAIDITLGIRELEGRLEILKPKIVFCQTDRSSDIETALNKLNSKTHIITFDRGNKFCCFTDFLQDEAADDIKIEDFKPTDFDPEETVAAMMSTSGTTGQPKLAPLTHKNLALSVRQRLSPYNSPPPKLLLLFISPIWWVTAVNSYVLSTIFRVTRLQSSAPRTMEHIRELINKYKPHSATLNPNVLTSLLTSQGTKCDFSCFSTIVICGCYLPKSLSDAIKDLAPNAVIVNIYGMSECGGVCMTWDVRDPITSICSPNAIRCTTYGHLQYRGYYNNPESRKDTFSEDGWFRTGDIMKRDSNYNYFFVDRVKTLINYRHKLVSPTEVEEVIRSHPGVYDVAVIGVPDEGYCDLPAACVVPRTGYTLTEEEIKDLVKENLDDHKQLRGGVVFMAELPTTATSKTDRRKLKEMLAEMKLE
ncbi:luciferin 4-monooxygenase-like isoform X2 [Ostrinia furnacalis]|uniref:luciferin 4-monooxygenase-like isoform X2 n=1 Tax=Ostrinia furnacalis TaxID=93504 RepID=UPI00103C3896|nr:luciferin 4-monooxygenase-like isoform X2 [Ostrinia furnacalis]